MADVKKLISDGIPGRRGRTEGKSPYLEGGEPYRAVSPVPSPLRRDMPTPTSAYMTGMATVPIPQVITINTPGITRKELAFGVLLGTAASFGVTGLLLIILLT